MPEERGGLSCRKRGLERHSEVRQIACFFECLTQSFLRDTFRIESDFDHMERARGVYRLHAGDAEKRPSNLDDMMIPIHHRDLEYQSLHHHPHR